MKMREDVIVLEKPTPLPIKPYRPKYTPQLQTFEYVPERPPPGVTVYKK